MKKKFLFLFISCFINLLNAQQYDSIIYYIQNYEFENAISLIDKSENLDSDIRLLNLKATCLKSLNKYHEAVPLFEKIFTTDTTNYKIAIELANCYLNAGNYKNTIVYFKKAITPDNKSYVLQQIANAYFKDNDYKNALSAYLVVYKTDSSWYILKQLAESYNFLEEYDSAVIFYEKTLNINPADVNSTYRLAEVYKNQACYGKGISVAETYLKLDSVNTTILKLNGFLYFLAKDYNGSIINLEKCILLSDSSDFINKYLGFSYFKTKKYEKAVEFLEKAYKKDTMNSDLCYALGLSCANWAYKKKGIEYLNKSIDLVTPSIVLLARIYQDLGNACSEFYKYDDALNAYLKAYELTPNDTLLIFTIASHYDNWLKDKNKALEYYQLFMETRPKEKRPLPNDDDILYISYYDFVERRIKEIKEELFWKGEEK